MGSRLFHFPLTRHELHIPHTSSYVSEIFIKVVVRETERTPLSSRCLEHLFGVLLRRLECARKALYLLCEVLLSCLHEHMPSNYRRGVQVAPHIYASFYDLSLSERLLHRFWASYPLGERAILELTHTQRAGGMESDPRVQRHASEVTQVNHATEQGRIWRHSEAQQRAQCGDGLELFC